MKIPSGTRVGLCAHIPIHPVVAGGMVLDVTTDAGTIVVLVCDRCWVRYTAEGELEPIVTRQFVTGRGGWDVKVEMEAAS